MNTNMLPLIVLSSLHYSVAFHHTTSHKRYDARYLVVVLHCFTIYHPLSVLGSAPTARPRQVDCGAFIRTTRSRVAEKGWWYVL